MSDTTFNNLRKQIHGYQKREHLVRKFLRALDKDETIDLKGGHNLFLQCLEEFLSDEEPQTPTKS